MLLPRFPFALPPAREEEGRREVAALCTPNIAFITRLASPRAAKSSSSPLPACSTLYFPPSYDEYLSSRSASLSLSRLHPLHPLLYFSYIPFLPTIFLLIYFLPPSYFSFFFFRPLIRSVAPFSFIHDGRNGGFLFKFIVLLNHEATRGRGKLITPAR